MAFETIYRSTVERISKIRNLHYFILLIILLLTAGIYSNSINIGFVNFDDNLFVYNNYQLKYSLPESVNKYFTESYGGHYHPVTMILFAIEYKLFGLDARYFHMLKMFFHLINIVLVFFIIRSLTFRNDVSAITACFFAINPVNVETVTWISAQGAILFSCFYLASILSYIYFIKNQRRSLYWILAFVFYILSLLSKSQAVTLPLILLLIDYYYSKKHLSIKWKVNEKLIMSLLPFIILSFIFGVIAMLSAKEFGTLGLSKDDYTGIDRIFLIFYSVAFYIVKLFVPSNLNILYYNPVKTDGLLSPEYYLAPLFIIALVLVIWRSGKFRKEMMFGILFFLINIILILQFISVGNTIVCERYDYIPSIGVFFIVGQLFAYVADDKIRYSQRIKPYLLFVFTGLIIYFSIKTWNRNTIWGDDVELYTKVIEKYPEKAHTYCARGGTKLLKKDYKGAIVDITKGIELNANNRGAFFRRGIAYYNLGKYQKAIEDFDETISLSKDYVFAYTFRARAKVKLNDMEGAIDDYNKAEKISDKFVLNYYYRAQTRKKLNDYNKAIEDYSKAVELYPEFTAALYERGLLRYRLKDIEGALEDYEQVLKNNYKKYYVYYNRGNARKDLKDYENAIRDYSKAIELKPDFYHAWNNRGIVKYFSKDLKGALADYNKTIELKPDFPDVYNNRAIVKYYLKDHSGACEDWKNAADLGYEDAGNMVEKYCR